MSTTKLITMYGSPWSERVRWAFDFKRLPYEKQNYQPGVDEEEVKKLTGQALVPVLLTDGKVIPDSTAILEWLEDSRPEPALLPRSEKDRAQVTLWEELMTRRAGSASSDVDHRASSPFERARNATSRTVLCRKVRVLTIRGGAGQAHGEACLAQPQAYVERTSIFGW